MIIERAFDYLKGRWRSLLHVLAVNDIKFAPYHIFACCVLHNICLLQDDKLELQDQLILVTEQQEKREDGVNIIENNRNAAIIKETTYVKI